MNKIIVFTDLDGTLLDESSYSFAAAQPALDVVASSGTPLILCSSKTRAEIEGYRIRLCNTHPFISENGGGLFIPRDYFPFPIEAETTGDYQLIRLGLPYTEVREHFVRLRDQCHAKVRGFADMSTTEVATLTGLAEDQVTLAMQRDFDEPFIFDGETDEHFLNAIETVGLRWTQGRLFHIMGKHDKGRAVDILMSLYHRQYARVTSIALGDSLNDLPMLSAVDRPVLVRHRDGKVDSRVALLDMLETTQPGPAGWNEALLRLLPHDVDTNIPKLSDRQNLLDIFNAAIAAVDPYTAVLRAVHLHDNRLNIASVPYDLDAYERIIVVGAGKASARMGLAIESLLSDKLAAGLIIVKHGHTAPLSIINQIEAGHPVPDADGVKGAHNIQNMLRAADEKTLVICLLSGGASALLVAPAEGLSLEDKQETTRLLLNAGATINELNTVRKHLSSIKGGGLARAASPAQLVTLILSDVIGDPLDVIASGPTTADTSTFHDAWTVVEKYNLQHQLPVNVTDHLQRGLSGDVAETVKVHEPCLKHTQNVIVAGIHEALDAAMEKAKQLGFATRILTDSLQGEAREAARFLSQAAGRELDGMQPDECRCLLSGGETTVTVHGAGMGGRSQELALAFALEAESLQLKSADVRGIALLSAGTDGTDGPNDAAGAIVDGLLANQARRNGIDPERYLGNNDSYNFFQDFDDTTGALSHLKTGPTGTNVMDIQIVLLNKKAQS